jgi:hypothetical protein
MAFSQASALTAVGSIRHDLLTCTDYQPVVSQTPPERVAGIREHVAGISSGNEFIKEFGRPIADLPIRKSLLNHHDAVVWDGQELDRIFRRKFGSEILSCIR